MASFDGRTGAEDPGDAASTPAQVAARRRWMSVLAKASYSELQDLTVDVELPAFTWLRRPETGAVMVRGRAGGTGSAFNMGEMTITRCAVRIDAAATGHAYVQGWDPRHAELAKEVREPRHGDAEVGRRVQLKNQIRIAQQRDLLGRECSRAVGRNRDWRYCGYDAAVSGRV